LAASQRTHNTTTVFQKPNQATLCAASIPTAVCLRATGPII
jgi:hypothetical protein